MRHSVNLRRSTRRTNTRGHRLRVTGAMLGMLGLLPLAVLTTTSAPASASPAPITIAYITSITGPGAAEDASSPAGFDARIAMQNAEGGVDGHKLVPLVIDDQTSPAADRDRGTGGRFEGVRDRLAEPTLLPGGQVPAAGRASP